VVLSHLNSGALGSGAAGALEGVLCGAGACANAKILAPAKLNIRNNFFISCCFSCFKKLGYRFWL
jgi:hypothetical protein